MNISRHFAHWDVYAMYTAIAVILGFELMGVFSGRYITITHIIRQHIPEPVRWMILGWLVGHFK